MKPDVILEELEAAAAKLGVKVSYDSLAETDGGGGLCKVKGAYRVIIEKRGTVGEKLATLAKALAEIGVEGVFLSPDARRVVEQVRRVSAA